MANNSETAHPFTRSLSADTSINHSRPVVLMTHTETLPGSSEQSSLSRRTLDSAIRIRENFTNVMREIEPLVATARTVNNRGISITNLLNRPSQSEPNVSGPSGSLNHDSVVINFGNANITPSGTENTHSNAALLLNNVGDRTDGNANNNNEDLNNQERIQSVEAQQLLGVILKYVPFALLLIAKGLYDHHEAILNVIVLFATFTYANGIVRNEALKRGRRSLSRLFMALFYVVCCIFYIHYIFEEEQIHLNLVFIRTYSKPLSVWDLLWYVTITDFILKLITVGVKVVITLLPGRIIAFQKRGKIYLFIEALSQMYRCLAPIQPWLFYLLDSYQGAEKIIGVFLAAFYMVSKGADLMSHLKLLKTAVVKVLQNVAIGSSPSKEQIQSAGEHCPICHDEYDSPVLLECHHIFCEGCVTTWFDREQTCPLCRAKIVDDPSWRDGSTTYFMQLF